MYSFGPFEYQTRPLNRWRLYKIIATFLEISCDSFKLGPKCCSYLGYLGIPHIQRLCSNAPLSNYFACTNYFLTLGYCGILKGHLMMCYLWWCKEGWREWKKPDGTDALKWTELMGLSKQTEEIQLCINLPVFAYHGLSVWVIFYINI